MTNLLYKFFDDWKAQQPTPTDPVPVENVKASFPAYRRDEETLIHDSGWHVKK
jgi:hypothetical protein